MYYLLNSVGENGSRKGETVVSLVHNTQKGELHMDQRHKGKM